MKEQEIRIIQDSSVQAKIKAEIDFLRTLREEPRFCCQGCGDQKYRVIMRGTMPVGGGAPPLWGKMRLCDPCFDQNLTAAEESDIINNVR